MKRVTYASDVDCDHVDGLDFSVYPEQIQVTSTSVQQRKRRNTERKSPKTAYVDVQVIQRNRCMVDEGKGEGDGRVP